MYKSLKDFVDFLESKGELIRIKEFVDPVLEIAEITDRISKQPGGGKAILFENTGTDYPVLTNMMGSEKRMAAALGVESIDEIPQIMNDLMKDLLQPRSSLLNKIKLLPQLKEASEWFPKRHKGHAPCQEVILYKPDLSRLPILQCWPFDGGRFVTLPLVHTKDPKTGIRNVGMYRMQVFTENTTGMHWHRHKTGARHFAECENDRFPVAVCIGGDPVYTYAATAPLPDGIDEYLFAGFLRNKAVSLVDCLTQDLQVPADCDFVLEGYIEKNAEPVIEGPFGDHTGFYSLPDMYPTFHITCISHRKDAIYPATLVGIPPQEDKYIALATEKIFLSPIKFTMAPEVHDLYLPEEGVGHNIAVVSIKKSYPGQAIKVAHALWGAGQMMFNKMMIVTDADVDIRNREELLQCIQQNYLPKRDTHFSRGPMDVLDHAAQQCGYGGKIMIDATVKFDEEGGSVKNSSISNLKTLHFTSNVDELLGIVNIILDNERLAKNDYFAMWLLGNNFDPVRDSSYVDGKLVIDCRSKSKGYKGFTRDWPEYALSSNSTIEAINSKWETLGIGEFTESPSALFKRCFPDNYKDYKSYKKD